LSIPIATSWEPHKHIEKFILTSTLLLENGMIFTLNLMPYKYVVMSQVMEIASPLHSLSLRLAPLIPIIFVA
jgi:hypothetical protein